MNHALTAADVSVIIFFLDDLIRGSSCIHILPEKKIINGLSFSQKLPTFLYTNKKASTNPRHMPALDTTSSVRSAST